MINLKEYNYPGMSAADAVFPTVNTDKVLLKEAKERGFDSMSNPWNNYFSDLFFTGGEIEFQEGLDKEVKTKMWRYCRALMGSFAPKHEDKTAVCAMLMSELLVLPKDKK